MAKKCEFHFDFGSPNSYYAHVVIPEIEERTGVKIEYIPILLGGVFKATGNQSPAMAYSNIPNKMAYMGTETRRFLKKHPMPFQSNPDFPVNTLMLMRGAVYAKHQGFLPEYVDAGFLHMWVEPKKMDDPEVLMSAFAASGLDAKAIAEGTQDPDVKAALIANTEDSVGRGCFGAPTFFCDDEMFFGKDQLGDFEEEILS